MSNISERLAQCVEKSGMTKTAFAEKIKVSQSYVSNLCNGLKEPSDRTISDICRVFDISETWLRTGEGDMYVPKDRDQEIAEFFGDVLKGEPDFRRRFISVLARLTADEWALIERKIRELADDL